ncbi:MAG: rod shape-determining protein MreD [Tepidisphaerales bacterium]
MRWFVFLIFAYVLLGAQIGLGEHFRVLGASPNLVLLGVVFVALNTPREVALTAALLLGLFHDLAASGGPFGLFAVAYSLVALAATAVNREVYTDHPLTHFFSAMLGQLMVVLVTVVIVLLQQQIRGAPYGAADAPSDAPPDAPPPLRVAGIAYLPLLASCLYTALLAPLVLGVVARVKGVFGFEPLRRRIRPY